MGLEIGTIQKKTAKHPGEQYRVEQNGVEILRISGDFISHDYTMEANDQSIAQISRKWVSLPDQYCVSITGKVDHRLIIGATIVVEHVEVSEQASFVDSTPYD